MQSLRSLQHENLLLQQQLSHACAKFSTDPLFQVSPQSAKLSQRRLDTIRIPGYTRNFALSHLTTPSSLTPGGPRTPAAAGVSTSLKHMPPAAPSSYSTPHRHTIVTRPTKIVSREELDSDFLESLAREAQQREAGVSAGKVAGREKGLKGNFQNSETSSSRAGGLWARVDGRDGGGADESADRYNGDGGDPDGRAAASTPSEEAHYQTSSSVSVSDALFEKALFSETTDDDIAVGDSSGAEGRPKEEPNAERKESEQSERGLHASLAAGTDAFRGLLDESVSSLLLANEIDQLRQQQETLIQEWSLLREALMDVSHLENGWLESDVKEEKENHPPGQAVPSGNSGDALEGQFGGVLEVEPSAEAEFYPQSHSQSVAGASGASELDDPAGLHLSDTWASFGSLPGSEPGLVRSLEKRLRKYRFQQKKMLRRLCRMESVLGKEELPRGAVGSDLLESFPFASVERLLLDLSLDAFRPHVSVNSETEELLGWLETSVYGMPGDKGAARSLLAVLAILEEKLTIARVLLNLTPFVETAESGDAVDGQSEQLRQYRLLVGSYLAEVHLIQKVLDVERKSLDMTRVAQG